MLIHQEKLNMKSKIKIFQYKGKSFYKHLITFGSKFLKKKNFWLIYFEIEQILFFKTKYLGFNIS